MTLHRVTPSPAGRRAAGGGRVVRLADRVATPPATTVRSADVHKTRQDALLLHSWRRTAPHRFAVTARWAAEHPFYRTGAARTPDPMMVIETLRQAVILVAHTGYDVPRSAAFVMGAISADITPGTRIGAGGTSVTVEVACRDVVVRGGSLRSLRAEVVFLAGGRVIARGTGDLVAVRAEVYHRVRAGRTATDHVSTLPRLDASVVGRGSHRDVVLSPHGPDSWRLALDTTHPYLFDHGNDHVPGMVLLEAARQVHAAVHGARPVGTVDAVFHRYAEFRPEVELRLVAPDRSGTTCVEACQDGTPVARFRLEWAALPLAA